MSVPLVVSIPHHLGKDEAHRRLKNGLAEVGTSFGQLFSAEAEDHTLYASHTVWQSKAAFEAWTKSEEFRAAHARAGNEVTGPLYLEHPKFEGFEVRQTITPKAAVA